MSIVEQLLQIDALCFDVCLEGLVSFFVEIQFQTSHIRTDLLLYFDDIQRCTCCKTMHLYIPHSYQRGGWGKACAFQVF